MNKQIEPIDEKFIESYSTDEWEVETEDGWKDITHIHKTIKYDVWQLDTVNYSLKCADDHIVMVEGSIQKFIKDLTCDDKVITKTGLENVISIKKLDIDSDNMYDLSIDSDNHTYFTDGILSHNSTISSIFLLWYVLFNKDKTVAIMANKESLAIEILEKIKMSFSKLPKWLQQGVTDDGWNKKKLSLENGSRLIAAATSSNALTGYTINLLYLDEFAKVPQHIADDFIASVYPVITSGKSSKIIMVSCVTDDTFVLTPNGISQVSEFIDYDREPNGDIGYAVSRYTVCGRRGFNDGSLIVNSGFVPTRILSTVSSKIECSLNHKLWISRDGECKWETASQLTTNDYLCIKYGQDIWGNNDSIDSDLVYLLGMFIANGKIFILDNTNNDCINGITISSNDYIGNFLKKLELDFCCFDNINYTIFSKYLNDIMKTLNFDLSNDQISIPKKLYSLTKDNMINLIQGIFDSSAIIDDGIISISHHSQFLISQIRAILNNFGILSELSQSDNSFKLLLNKTMSDRFFHIINFKFIDKKQIITDSNSILKFKKEKWEKISYINESNNNVYDFSLNETGDDWCHSVMYNNIVGHQTPYGMNHFYNFWVNANRKDGNENSFYPISVNWQEIPGRDEKFKKKIVKDIGISRWLQEFQCPKVDTLLKIRHIDTKIEETIEIGELFNNKKYK